MPLLDRFGVVAFPPGPGLDPEPVRRQLPNRAAAGRVMCVQVRGVRVRCIGWQEMRLQRRRPRRIKARRLICHHYRVLPRQGPGLQRLQSPRQAAGQGVGGGQERRRRPRTQGQHAPDLRRDRHLLRHHRRPRPRHSMRSLRVRHRSLRLHPRNPRLHLPGPGKNIQAAIGQTGQRISIRERLQTRPVHLSLKHSKGNTDLLERPHRRRLPHKPIMARGSDKQSWPPQFQGQPRFRGFFDEEGGAKPLGSRRVRRNRARGRRRRRTGATGPAGPSGWRRGPSPAA